MSDDINTNPVMDDTTSSDDSANNTSDVAATKSTSNVVFVGSLAWGTDAESLRRFFEEGGLQIAEDETKDDGFVKKAVVVVKDRDTGRSKGYGFVTLVSADEAEKAVATLNDKELDGRQIRVQVKEDRPREDRPRRFNSDSRRPGGYQRRDNNRGSFSRDDRSFNRSM
jgi:RNA recognition motif-containing protein